MNATAKELYGSALQLSDAERAELAALLIASLDPEYDRNLDEAWEAEIKRRTDELDAGAVKAIPWSEARCMILGHSDGPTAD